jgi:hypothetical protein
MVVVFILLGCCHQDHKDSAMNVQQLIQALSTLPPQATVLLEGDVGYSPLGSVAVVSGGGGLPDEVLLQPDMTPD